MSEILNKIDINSYGLQPMKASGGSTEDLTEVLNTQDTLIANQETKIEQMVSALANKKSIDLQQETSDATATAGDIASGKTAYVNGIKLIGEAEGNIPDWSVLGFETTPQGVIDDYNYSKDIQDNWNASVTSMYAKYNNNKELRYFPFVDTSNVTNMERTFYDADKLTDIALIDTGNVTNMNETFYGTKISSVPDFDYSNVTSMYGTFKNIQTFKIVPAMNTTKVRNFSETFSSSRAIETVGLIDLSSATNIERMFGGCYALKSISQLNTSKVDNMRYTFQSCTSLENIPVLDTTNVGMMDSAFSNCTNLTNDSLNNIMKMCINTTRYGQTKTLKYIGLSEAQATTCQSLSNYNDFINAGWTTGY